MRSIPQGVSGLGSHSLLLSRCAPERCVVITIQTYEMLCSVGSTRGRMLWNFVKCFRVYDCIKNGYDKNGEPVVFFKCVKRLSLGHHLDR